MQSVLVHALYFHRFAADAGSESVQHKLRPLWDKLFAFLTKMGEPNVPVDHRYRVVIFGLKDRKNLASEGVRTTMRLAIRYIYSALTAQELDGTLFG